LYEVWRLQSGLERTIAAAYRIILVYLFFACLWFQPWYLIWLLTLAALRPRLDIAHLSMLFSFTATMNYFVFDYLWMWNTAHFDFLAVQAIAVAVIYGLPLCYGLRLLLRQRQLRRHEAFDTRC
jgi:apolipoprotein N-acyltransferase